MAKERSTPEPQRWEGK